MVCAPSAANAIKPLHLPDRPAPAPIRSSSSYHDDDHDDDDDDDYSDD